MGSMFLLKSSATRTWVLTPVAWSAGCELVTAGGVVSGAAPVVKLQVTAEATGTPIRRLHQAARADRALRPVALALLSKMAGRKMIASQTPDAVLRLYLAALVVASKVTHD